jgi:hypothetical protein
MTRVQLRPFYSPEELVRVYDHQYTHTWWPDHIERVAETARVLDEFAASVGARSIADLSCGDGAIVLQSRHPWERRTLGDYTSTGPIETELDSLDHVDMYLCSETLEHVEDPDALLAKIRSRADYMLLTTPHAEADSNNPEHYWSWDQEDIRVMLDAAGWTRCEVQLWTPKSIRYYTFQMWVCS